MLVSLKFKFFLQIFRIGSFRFQNTTTFQILNRLHFRHIFDMPIMSFTKKLLRVFIDLQILNLLELIYFLDMYLINYLFIYSNFFQIFYQLAIFKKFMCIYLILFWIIQHFNIFQMFPELDIVFFLRFYSTLNRSKIFFIFGVYFFLCCTLLVNFQIYFLSFFKIK